MLFFSLILISGFLLGCSGIHGQKTPTVTASVYTATTTNTIATSNTVSSKTGDQNRTANVIKPSNNKLNNPSSTPTASTGTQNTAPTSTKKSLAPVLKYPFNNESVGWLQDLVVEWGPVPGASAYELEVTDAAKKVLTYSVGSGTKFSIPSAELKSTSGNFIIRVASITSAGKFWSQPVSVSNLLDSAENFVMKFPLGPGVVVVPHKNLTIEWNRNPYAYIHLGLEDANDSGKYIGKFLSSVTSYTIPASSLVEGHSYKFSLESINSEDFYDPNGQSAPPQSLPDTICVHTLGPLPIIYPKDGSTVPKGNITVNWTRVPWNDASTYWTTYIFTAEDLTLNGAGVEIDGRGNISSSELVSGHTYRVTVEVRLPGWNQIPADDQISTSTFTVS